MSSTSLDILASTFVEAMHAGVGKHLSIKDMVIMIEAYPFLDGHFDSMKPTCAWYSLNRDYPEHVPRCAILSMHNSREWDIIKNIRSFIPLYGVDDRPLFRIATRWENLDKDVFLKNVQPWTTLEQVDGIIPAAEAVGLLQYNPRVKLECVAFLHAEDSQHIPLLMHCDNLKRVRIHVDVLKPGYHDLRGKHVVLIVHYGSDIKKFLVSDEPYVFSNATSVIIKNAPSCHAFTDTCFRFHNIRALHFEYFRQIFPDWIDETVTSVSLDSYAFNFGKGVFRNKELTIQRTDYRHTATGEHALDAFPHIRKLSVSRSYLTSDIDYIFSGPRIENLTHLSLHSVTLSNCVDFSTTNLNHISLSSCNLPDKNIGLGVAEKLVVRSCNTYALYLSPGSSLKTLTVTPIKIKCDHLSVERLAVIEGYNVWVHEEVSRGRTVMADVIFYGEKLEVGSVWSYTPHKYPVTAKVNPKSKVSFITQ